MSNVHADEPGEGKKAGAIRDRYRELLGRSEMTEREIDQMRANVVRIARTICEHVWGKSFY